MPKRHLAYFILDLVAELDLDETERRIQAKDHRGSVRIAMRARLMRPPAVPHTLDGRPLNARSKSAKDPTFRPANAASVDGIGDVA